MEQFFKYVLSEEVLDNDLYLDTRPKFFKAIMRRLGVDMTKKISFREFASLLKPLSPELILIGFN